MSEDPKDSHLTTKIDKMEDLDSNSDKVRG